MDDSLRRLARTSRSRIASRAQHLRGWLMRVLVFGLVFSKEHRRVEVCGAGVLERDGGGKLARVVARLELLAAAAPIHDLHGRSA